jgi:hypothetical protein
MPEEESNFCALAVFSLPINQLRRNPTRPKKSATAREGQRQ